MSNTIPETISNLPIIEDIKDICLDLLDAGFYIEVCNQTSSWSIKIWKFLPDHTYTSPGSTYGYFEYEEISEDVERLKDYLLSKGRRASTEFLRNQILKRSFACVNSIFNPSMRKDIEPFEKSSLQFTGKGTQ